MKKLLLTAAMAIMAAFSAHPFTVDGVTYSTSDGVATVTGASDKAITKLTIPATVTYRGTTYPVNFMEGDAFWNCTSLRELVIEDSDNYIGTNFVTKTSGTSTFAELGDPFRDSPLEKIYVGRNLANRLGNGNLQAPTPISSTAPSVDLTIAGKATFIPQGIAANMNMTFINRTNITSLTIGGNVENVYNKAFSGCTGLKKVTLLPGETGIRFESNTIFTDCPIESLIMGRDISSSYQCGGAQMKTVIITDELNHLSDNIFYSCSSIKHVVLNDSENRLETSISYNNIFESCELESVYIGRYYTVGPMFGKSKIKKVTYGPLITNVEKNSFLTHSDLEQVIFSDNMVEIEHGAFCDCTSLTEITFPQSLKKIGNDAFRGCKSLTKADLTPNIETIGHGAFSNTALKSVVVPKSVTSIDGEAFGNCKLELVTIEDGENSISLAEEYQWGVFNDCSIDSAYIGRPVSDPSLLFQRGQVKKAEFGPAYTEIGRFFNLTTGLEYINLPESVTKISGSIFSNCPNIKEVFSRSQTPPLCESNHTFPTEVYDSAVLTVPAGSKKAYRAAEVWKLFKNIQSEGGGFKVTVTCDSSLGEVALNGSNVAEITVDEDEPLTIAITPIEGYKVAKMTVNGTDVTASLVDNAIAYESIDSNMDIVVEFDIITFAVNLPAGLTGGHIVVNGQETAPATVDYGSRLELAAVADRGYELTSLSVNETDVIESLDENGTYVIESVTADISVEAAFDPIVYTVTAVNLTDYGTLTLNGEAGDCKVAFGQPLVIGVMPRDEGCYLVALTVDGTDVTAGVTGGTYTVETVEADMTVEAVFGFYTYTVELGYDPAMGTIIPDQPGGDSDVTVAHGTTLRLTILPAEGYEIATVTLDGDDVTGRVDDSGVLTLENITAAHRVEATFDIKRVRLSVLGLQGGQLAMRYDYGTEVTLLVEPEDGWEFHSLTVGDTTVTELEPDGSYTTPALTDDTAVSVVFKLAGQSGADSPAEARMITVATRGTTVIVTGARDGELVEVFDTAGVAVYRGAEHEIDLNRQGIHIVRVAGLTFKVMLR